MSLVKPVMISKTNGSICKGLIDSFRLPDKDQQSLPVIPAKCRLVLSAHQLWFSDLSPITLPVPLVDAI